MASSKLTIIAGALVLAACCAFTAKESPSLQFDSTNNNEDCRPSFPQSHNANEAPFLNDASSLLQIRTAVAVQHSHSVGKSPTLASKIQVPVREQALRELSIVPRTASKSFLDSQSVLMATRSSVGDGGAHAHDRRNAEAHHRGKNPFPKLVAPGTGADDADSGSYTKSDNLGDASYAAPWLEMQKMQSDLAKRKSKMESAARASLAVAAVAGAAALEAGDLNPGAANLAADFGDKDEEEAEELDENDASPGAGSDAVAGKDVEGDARSHPGQIGFTCNDNGDCSVGDGQEKPKTQKTSYECDGADCSMTLQGNATGTRFSANNTKIGYHCTGVACEVGILGSNTTHTDHLTETKFEKGTIGYHCEGAACSVGAVLPNGSIIDPSMLHNQPHNNRGKVRFDHSANAGRFHTECVKHNYEALDDMLGTTVKPNEAGLVLAAFGESINLLQSDEPADTKDTEASLKLFTLDAKVIERQRFNAGGHRASGDRLKLSNGFLGYRHMKLPEGFNVSYGDISALCGDYYGSADNPVSNGKSLDERQKLFSKYVWGCLANDTDDPNRMFPISHFEKKLVNATSNMPDACSSHLELLSTDFDHFGAFAGYTAEENGGGLGAWETYSAGHSVACKTAASGKLKQAALQTAMMQNACASHFLSDMFSAGHLRVPRRMLDGKHLGHFAYWMHDEDNVWGLNVENKKGDRWRAYGDNCHAEVKNKWNKQVELNALTASAEAVLKAWKDGNITACQADEEVALLTPDLALVQDPKQAKEQGNSSPLFVPMNVHEELMGKGAFNGTGIRTVSCDMEMYNHTSCWWQMSAYMRLKKCPKKDRGNKSFPHMNCHDPEVSCSGCD